MPPQSGRKNAIRSEWGSPLLKASCQPTPSPDAWPHACAHSHTEPSATVHATCFLVPPQTAAPLASNYSDFHKERLWPQEQHGHLSVKMSPREERRSVLGHQGFQRSSHAVPLPSRIHLHSLPDRTATEHTPSPSSPLSQGFPSKLLTLAELSLPGTVPPLFQVLSALRSIRIKSHPPIPLGPTLLPWRLASHSFPVKPKRQGKKEVPQW